MSVEYFIGCRRMMERIDFLSFRYFLISGNSKVSMIKRFNRMLKKIYIVILLLKIN